MDIQIVREAIKKKVEEADKEVLIYLLLVLQGIEQHRG